MTSDMTTQVGPRGSWLLGNMGAYNADPLAFMAATAREYGDFVPLRLGPIRGVLISDPQSIESVLVEHPKSFHKSRGIHRLSSLLGNGIFTSEGDYWLSHRRLMQPAFNKASVERYEEVMVRRTAAALDRWAGLDQIDISRRAASPWRSPRKRSLATTSMKPRPCTSARTSRPRARTSRRE
jgi:cytochrome P450